MKVVINADGPLPQTLVLNLRAQRRRYLMRMGLLILIGAVLLTIPLCKLEGCLGDTPATVAVIYVDGAIYSADSPYNDAAGEVTSGQLKRYLAQVNGNDSIKAIVLRVNSPGGSVTGSAQIYEMLSEVTKPLVVSMGATAASGGYYISAPADYIFARPDTITGSIGVIMTLYNAEELIDAHGVDVIHVTSGPHKALGSSWEVMTTEQHQILQALVDEAYGEFVRVIMNGRQLDEATVRGLADGRIYTGRQALDLGLVDELGDLDEAIAKAAELGGAGAQPRVLELGGVDAYDNTFSGLSQLLGYNEANQLLDVVNRVTSPRLEYRYLGPVPG